MPLSDIISNAKSSLGLNQMGSTIKSSAVQSFKSTKTEIAGIPAGIVNSAKNQVTSGITGAINSGLTDAREAANLALHGDFSGALEKIAMGPQDILGKLSSSFGLSSGSTLRKGDADPTNSLAGALARSDPMMSFDWYCILPDVAPVGGAPVALPWYFVEEATPPFRTFDQRTIYSQGRNKHYPSTYSVDTLRLALYADVETKSQQYINAWQGAIVKPTSSKDTAQGGGFGRPRDYKKSIQLFLVNPMRQQLMMLEYIECWPQSVESYTLDSGSSGRLVNNVTFSVGDVFVTLFNTANSNLLADPNSTGTRLANAAMFNRFG